MGADVHIKAEQGTSISIRVDGTRVVITVESAQSMPNSSTKAPCEPSAYLPDPATGRFRGRSDEEAKEAIRVALAKAPRGLGRKDLRAAAGVKSSRLVQIQHEMLASGEIRRHGRKLLLSGQARQMLAATTPAVMLTDPYVYFIEAAVLDGRGQLKIGVANSPQGRLDDLQKASPVKLKLIATIPNGGYALERRLHEMFADERLHGEWFRPSERLLTWIRDHAVPCE